MSEFRIPSHVGKTPAEILAIEQLDAGGHLYKSMAWLNYFERVPVFSPLLYACIDARYGIEYLLFEELVISTGANLSQADYQRCTGERNRFIKTIEQLTPDYLLLKRFTRLVASLEPRAPKLIDWNLKGLMRDWGEMSHFLHWVGARGLTTEDTAWLVAAHEKIVATVKPIWINLTSGRSAMLHPKDMHPIAMGVWEEFKRGEINEATVKFQLTVLRPAGA